jgi:hypothetical protein
MTTAEGFHQASSSAEPPFPQPERVDLPHSLETLVLIERDKNVFGEIFDAIAKSWGSLEEAEKKNLLRWVQDVRAAVHHYQECCEALDKIAALKLKDSEQYTASVERSDAKEKAAHDALVDSLNILSRNMKELGMSNSWRMNDAIYSPGDHAAMRTKIGAWGRKVRLEPEALAA